MKNKTGGFTIVELLIVIVVIGILATISVVTFQNVQHRARDSQRVQDMKTIEKALRMHLVEFGSLPAANGSTPTAWENSTNNGGEGFLSALVDSGIISEVPIDPLNKPTPYDAPIRYRYYKFSAGQFGCDSSKGAYAVLQVTKMESHKPKHPNDPDFRCLSDSWRNEGSYTLGIFENG